MNPKGGQSAHQSGMPWNKGISFRYDSDQPTNVSSAVLSNPSDERMYPAPKLQCTSTIRASRVYFVLLIEFWHINIKAVGQFYEGSDHIEIDRWCWTHKAIMSDFHKSCWKNMLQEAPHKLHGIQCHGPPSMAVGFFVTKKYLAIFNLYDAAIWYGHLEDVWWQILDRFLAGAHGLAVDHEVLLPHSGVNIFENIKPCEFISQLCPEDLWDNLYRGKEVKLGRMPCAVWCG